MSTPEEQRRQQDPRLRPVPPAEPVQPEAYGTQTWQSETWDTSYQPVQPSYRPVPPPPAPMAPEGWFRDDSPPAPAPQPQPYAEQQPYGEQQPQPYGAPAQPYPYPYPEQAQPGPYQQPRPYQQSPAPAPQPYPQQAQPQAYQPPQQQSPAPESWFRDPAPAPVADAAPAQAPATAPAPDRAETAYLPPYREAPAESTAYLPPYRDPEPYAAPAQPYPQQAQPQPYPQQAPAPQQQSPAPESWFRDPAPVPVPVADAAPAQAQAPAAAPAPDWAETAYLPPYREAPAERTAYLPPVTDLPPGGGNTAPAAAAGGAAPVPGEEPGFSPPTLAGSTRVVDPAQARAEGRSPIIDPGPQPALLTAVLGVLLAVAAALGQFALLLPLIALQGLTAAGWFRLNGMWPARQGIALAFAGAVVADVAVLAVDRTHAPAAVIGTLGAWVLLTLVLQLRSHADPDERVYGLMASVASAALAVVCAGYLAAAPAAVTVGAASVAVAAFARALPLPAAPSVAVSLAAAAGAGLAVGALTSVGAGGALIGLAAGVCALIGLRVAAYDYPSKFVHMTAGVALPLAVAAPAVYLVGRVVG